MGNTPTDIKRIRADFGAVHKLLLLKKNKKKKPTSGKNEHKLHPHVCTVVCTAAAATLYCYQSDYVKWIITLMPCFIILMVHYVMCISACVRAGDRENLA